MIHVDRASVSQPGQFTVGEIAVARNEAKRFFGRNRNSRLQETFDFPRLWQIPPVRQAVEMLFHAKCAFCETPVRDTEAGDVDQFRPRSGAVDEAGRVEADYYWWLAYEWRNQYLICSSCSRNKGNRFPVRGPRAKLESDWPEVDRERRLLLDPCADQPGDELIVHPDGLISGLTDPGKYTVEILSLNRDELIRSRQDEYERARFFASTLGSQAISGPDGLDPRVLAYIDAAQPFAAARRQAITDLAPRIAEQQRGPEIILTPGLGGNVAVGQDIYVSSAAQQSRDDREEFRKKGEEYSLADEGGPAKSYFLTSRTIQRVEIKDFRLLRDLPLDFPKHEGAWLMLLGENATGKSTILQAIALTLMGEDYRNQVAKRLNLDASRFVRHGATSGSVKIWLNGLSAPIELHVNRGSSSFIGSPPEPKTLVVAYGATRLLPRHGFAPASAPKYADVENLFNPFEPLSDATGWLLGLRPGRYQEAARALKTLLPIGPKDRLIRRRSATRPADRVQARFNKITSSLDELSDGYQSVLAMAADAIRVMQDYWSSMDSAEGIILIDELGAHMHPRWKMQLVVRLRTLFPRVQFLATTHDPLCLRGLRQGEVVVLRRLEDRGVFAISDLPPVEGLRADQLLTSEHFGLSSTLDPETEAMFDRYYELKAKRDLEPEEATELRGLEQQVKDRNMFGKDRRERMMLEIIDQYLADIREEGDPAKRESFRLAAIAEAERIYATIPPTEIPPTNIPPSELAPS